MVRGQESRDASAFGERTQYTEHVSSIYLVTLRSRDHVTHFKTVAHFYVFRPTEKTSGKACGWISLRGMYQNVQESSTSCQEWNWSDARCMWCKSELFYHQLIHFNWDDCTRTFNSTTIFTYRPTCDIISQLLLIMNHLNIKTWFHYLWQQKYARSVFARE